MSHWLELSVKTRAYALVEAPPKPRCLLLGFHGYAQRPDDCMDGLRLAELDDALLVAPMGQHHFYSRSGRVVASWMTKFHREHQVEQIIGLAQAVVEQLEGQHGKLPIYCMGFSQGASVAYRVGVMAGLGVARIFPLAGDIPPELVGCLSDWPPVPVTLLHGEGDEQVSGPLLEADLARLVEAGWSAEMLGFAGGHDYLPEAMKAMGARISAELDAEGPL